MQPWKRVEPTSFVKTAFRGITTKSFQMPDGSVRQYDVFDEDGIQHACVIALTSDNQVIIAEQFRPGPEKLMQEIPGGTIDPDESPLTAVTRELLEETCYAPGTIEPLGVGYKDAYMNASWHYFLARNCVAVDQEQRLGAGEYVNIRLISIDEFLENAKNGCMTDGDAVLLAYDKLMELKGKIS